MDPRPGDSNTVPPAVIDLSEGPDFASWAPLPDHDRILVGGHTVWLDWSVAPVVVAQPNRWGIVEQEFPPVPCLVECDPLVTPDLPLPDLVEDWLDRRHRSIERPTASALGQAAMTAAKRLAKGLEQIPGVGVAARPFARTVPLTTPLEAIDLITGLGSEGITGVRPLPGLAGGVALSVGASHTRHDLDRVVDVMGALVSTIRDARQ